MTDQPETICCGEHKPTNKGKPIMDACQLCPNSPTYYRNEPGYRERLARRVAAGEPGVVGPE